MHDFSDLSYSFAPFKARWQQWYSEAESPPRRGYVGYPILNRQEKPKFHVKTVMVHTCRNDLVMLILPSAQSVTQVFNIHQVGIIQLNLTRKKSDFNLIEGRRSIDGSNMNANIQSNACMSIFIFVS